MCDGFSLDEALSEGKYATDLALSLSSSAHLSMSSLLTEIVEHAKYVPQSIPTPETPVLLIIAEGITTLSAKSLHTQPIKLNLCIASHTGKTVRDWESAVLEDTWSLAGTSSLVSDCCENAVYWIDLPDHWEIVSYNGHGTPFKALTCPNVPVLKHLAFGSFNEKVPDSLEAFDPVHLLYAQDWAHESIPPLIKSGFSGFKGNRDE